MAKNSCDTMVPLKQLVDGTGPERTSRKMPSKTSSGKPSGKKPRIYPGRRRGK